MYKHKWNYFPNAAEQLLDQLIDAGLIELRNHQKIRYEPTKMIASYLYDFSLNVIGDILPSSTAEELLPRVSDYKKEDV